MKVLLIMVLWAILLAVCWPLAILVLVLWPVIWLLSIPFKIAAVIMEAILSLVKSILFLPARVLGCRP